MTSELSASLWHATTRETATYAPLSYEVSADLAIIGGGYTGCAAALRAAQAGARVHLIEADTIGSGGSGRNVGLVNAGLWLPPEDITALLGAKDGDRLSRILGQAPDLVFDLIETHGITCEATRSGTLHCAHAPRGLGDLNNRHRQLAAIGAPVQLLGRDQAVARVGSQSVHGALFDPRAGTVQPLAYGGGLARAAAQAGAQLHEQSPALSVLWKTDHWQITTPGGRIRAPRLIVATNAYTRNIQGMGTPDVIPVHYFQAATDPLPRDLLAQILPGKEGCWDTALVMSSWRLDQQGRLIIGGMGQLSHIGSFAHRDWLHRKIRQLFPDLAGAALTHMWFGRIAMTTEHLPKLLPPGAGALACFGYSGRGIGPGTVFGTRMADALLSGDMSQLPVPVSETHAIPFAGARQAYYETGATLTHLVSNRH